MNVQERLGRRKEEAHQGLQLAKQKKLPPRPDPVQFAREHLSDLNAFAKAFRAASPEP